MRIKGKKITLTCSFCGKKGHCKSFHKPLPKQKFCKGCKLILSDDAFYLVKAKKRPYLSHYCKECDNKKSKERYNISINSRIKRIFLAAKARSKNRDNWFLITEQDIIDQYNKQCGLCYYTGDQLLLQNGKHSMSLDRLNSDIGYIKDNIVLTCWFVNHMKKNEKHEVFLQWCKKICSHHKLI